MPAYIKYKAYYDKKSIASQLKERDYVYILQAAADNQGSKIPSTDFLSIGPYMVGKTAKQQLISAQDRNKQNASPSSHATTAVHA